MHLGLMVNVTMAIAFICWDITRLTMVVHPLVNRSAIFTPAQTSNVLSSVLVYDGLQAGKGGIMRKPHE